MTQSPQFIVPFHNTKGGPRRVVVGLTAHEIDDVLWHQQHRPQGPGSWDGPLARGYALRRACENVPPGFTDADVVIDEIRQVP